MTTMPSYYIPHGGGPCFFMDWTPPDMWTSLATFLKGFAADLPARPSAILLVSGHWAEPRFTLGSGTAPPLIYDYYGFPPHTYQLKYPAPGDPALARQAHELLEEAGFNAGEDGQRGFDHGVFVPMLLMFPDADIPVVQLSLRSDYDAAAHLKAGAALERLREQRVLIVGSGMSFHNMQVFRNPGSMAAAPAASAQFHEWLDEAVSAAPERRAAMLANWQAAPHARMAHPPGGEEHLLPLRVAAGAAGQDRGARVFSGLETRVSAYRFGG